MINYVEIRAQDDANNSELIGDVIGIIDAADSIIWHSKYYGVGEFEIYTPATSQALDILKIGNYVTTPESEEVGIIDVVKTSRSESEGLMIAASGRFAKSLLDRRHIYYIDDEYRNVPKVLSEGDNVETAVRELVADNAMDCPFNSNRDIPQLKLAPPSYIPFVFAEDKQTACDNLLEFTDSVLQEYEMSARIILDAGEKRLRYKCFVGTDRTEGENPVVFSSDFDNLFDTEYSQNNEATKNCAILGGAGQDAEKFYTTLEGTATGLDRREMFVDASSINKTYKEGTVEREYSDAKYANMLRSKGKEEISQRKREVSFTGEIDTQNSQFKYNVDYFIGDLVVIQDNELKKHATVRITEVTEVEDDNGYSITLKYE